MVQYQLIRSNKRKTLGLQVKGGEVFVRAPGFVSEQQVIALVREKSAWLKTKVDEQRLLLASQGSLFQQGAEIWIRGQLKRLNICYQSTSKTGIRIQEFEHELQLTFPEAQRGDYQQLQVAKQVKKQLESWLKQQAQLYIPQKLQHYSQLTDLAYQSFKIRRYKSRWGSCNNRGELSFNSLLMMAPDWVIDYVIVHELCHLQHLNHSPAFWQLVAKFYPQYAMAKQWLKSNQMKLSWK